jgi:hypothetical protein
MLLEAMHIELWWKKYKERNYLEDLEVCGIYNKSREIRLQ